MSYTLNLSDELIADILRRAEEWRKTPEEFVTLALQQKFKDLDDQERCQREDLEYFERALASRK